jgi:hypothetical protein
MEVIYYQNNYLTLFYDAASSLGHPVWYGFASGTEHRQSVMECVKLIDNEKPHYWLTDNRKMKAIRQADQEWFEQHIVPRMATSSLRKFATLISEDIFNQMAVEKLYQHASHLIPFEMKMFKDESAAYKWLKQDYPITSAPANNH